MVSKNKKIIAGMVMIFDRIIYFVSNSYLGCMKLAMARLSGGLIDQVVGAKLVEVTDEYIKGVTQEYKRRRLVQ